MHFRFYTFILSLFFLFISDAAFAWKMESDKVTVLNNGGNTITHISFRQSYSTVPAVFTLATKTGADPAALRVTNVTTTGFDVYSTEPDGSDGVHAQMSSVAYIAIEKGTHYFPDGTQLTVGTTNTNRFQSKSMAGTSWQSIALSGFTTTPVVLGEIQTRVNERIDVSVPSSVSQPWMTTVIDSVSSTGFSIALERSETSSGTLSNNETIAYLAIDSGLNLGSHFFGAADGNKIEYESILTSASITGWSDSTTGVTFNFAKTYTNPMVVSTKNTRNGLDGGWLRRRKISTSSIALTVDEDKSTDTERSHNSAEAAGILLFSRPFDVDFNYYGDASLLINEVMYKEHTTGTGNDEFVELYVVAGGNLKGIVISDQDAHYYTFPSYTVSAGDYVIFHTGTDPGGVPVITGVHHFYQGATNMWNNGGDDILLLQPSQDVTITADNRAFNAKPIDYMAYAKNSAGGAVDPIPTSLFGTTVSWNYALGTELKNAVAGESISLTPNATDSNKAACWERTTSNNASDNGCAGYLATQITGVSGDLNSWGNNNNAVTEISLAKSVLTIYDPYNGASNPKAIPGSILEYSITAKNNGGLGADNNSIKITDLIPANTKLCVSNVGDCTPPYFVDGTPTSGLTLASVLYSNNNGTSYAYTPVGDGQGGDSTVTHLQASMNGAFQAKTGVNPPNFSIKFRVIVK